MKSVQLFTRMINSDDLFAIFNVYFIMGMYIRAKVYLEQYAGIQTGESLLFAVQSFMRAKLIII